ncbi:hypothetical protein VPH35_135122 [Triticum aestivum]
MVLHIPQLLIDGHLRPLLQVHRSHLHRSHHRRQMSWTAMATLKNLTKKERAKLCPPPAQPIHKIKILLWAMEQANSSSKWTRRRCWAFRSRVEHPLDQEPTVHEVPLQIVQPPTESSETPKHKMRRTVVATSLPRCSPRFPRSSPRLNGGGKYV